MPAVSPRSLEVAVSIALLGCCSNSEVGVGAPSAGTGALPLLPPVFLATAAFFATAAFAGAFAAGAFTAAAFAGAFAAAALATGAFCAVVFFAAALG